MTDAAGRKKSRRIIQITAGGYGDANDGDVLLYALCDDGTLWRRWASSEGAPSSSSRAWHRVRDVPQPGEE